MKNILFSLLCMLSLQTFAQKLDLKKIERLANTAAYTETLTRFTQNDSSLTLDDYRLLYYGQAFQNKRDTMYTFLNTKQNNYFKEAGDSIDFHKLLALSLAILEVKPLDFDQLYYASVCYDKTEQPYLGAVYYAKFKNLIGTILSSGDGRKEKTAFVVISIPDEYTIINVLDLKTQSQALVSKKKKYYDILYVKNNDKGIEKLYFDINLFFGKWF